MLIKDILELSMSKTMADIAKDDLNLGDEKALRAALKGIKCEQQNGKKGWQYVGDQPEVLEQSIYRFCYKPYEQKL